MALELERSSLAHVLSESPTKPDLVIPITPLRVEEKRRRSLNCVRSTCESKLSQSFALLPALTVLTFCEISKLCVFNYGREFDSH